MNVIDIVLLIVLLVAFVLGCRKGIVKAVGTFAGIIVGIIAAKEFSEMLQPQLAKFFGQADEATARVMAFVIIFIVAVLLCSLLFRLIEKLFNAILLGWLNRLLGGILSLVIAVAVSSLVLNVYEVLDSRHDLLGRDKVKDSVLYEPIREALPALVPSLDMKSWKLPSLNLFEHEGVTI